MCSQQHLSKTRTRAAVCNRDSDEVKRTDGAVRGSHCSLTCPRPKNTLVAPPRHGWKANLGTGLVAQDFNLRFPVRGLGTKPAMICGPANSELNIARLYARTEYREDTPERLRKLVVICIRLQFLSPKCTEHTVKHRNLRRMGPVHHRCYI